MRKVYLKNVHDVQRLLSIIVRDLREGKLPPNVANAVVYAANSLLRTFEATDFEKRLADLEHFIAMKEVTPYKPLALEKPSKGENHDGQRKENQ